MTEPDLERLVPLKTTDMIFDFSICHLVALSHYLANMGREVPKIKRTVVRRWV